METTERFELDAFINSCHSDGLYVKDCNIHIQRWRGSEQYTITDLTNAMQPGKVCVSYTFEADERTRNNCEVINWLRPNFGDSLPMLLLLCNGLDWVEGQYGTAPHNIDGINVYKRDKESKKVFSPFAKLPALKAEPAKWTLPHVFKALLNGQFSTLKCTGKYSDDYAYDNAVNYGKGEFSDRAADFVRRIMESPSGWRTYGNKGNVSVCCHSFDCNEFTFKL